MTCCTFPFTKEDLKLDEVEVALSNGKKLVINPKGYLPEQKINEELQLRNMNATYYLADNQYGKYGEIVAMYRQELNEYADQATDEGCSHFLGSGEDFQDILRDIKMYYEKQKQNKEIVLQYGDQKKKDIFEKIWNEKLKWCEEIIEYCYHPSWLYEKFGYGQYQDIEGYCTIKD